jgi:hypothetical protein
MHINTVFLASACGTLPTTNPTLTFVDLTTGTTTTSLGSSNRSTVTTPFHFTPGTTGGFGTSAFGSCLNTPSASSAAPVGESPTTSPIEHHSTNISQSTAQPTTLPVGQSATPIERSTTILQSTAQPTTLTVGQPATPIESFFGGATTAPGIGANNQQQGTDNLKPPVTESDGTTPL